MACLSRSVAEMNPIMCTMCKWRAERDLQDTGDELHCVAVGYSVLHCVAVGYSVLQCVAVCCLVALLCTDTCKIQAMSCTGMQWVTLSCSVLKCVV